MFWGLTAVEVSLLAEIVITTVSFLNFTVKLRTTFKMIVIEI